VRTPDYEVDRRFWPDGHYEGGYLFRDALVVEVTPPDSSTGRWRVECTWESTRDAVPVVATEFAAADDPRLEVPFAASGAPGIDGVVVVQLSRWND
jgi:hypothetical protein